MLRPPTLISHSATPSFPATTRLEELVLWDYAFTLWSDHEPAFEVIWNESGTADTAPPTIRSDDFTRTIVFERLDVRDVQCARGSAEGVTFAAPAAPAIESVEQLTIGNDRASIAFHLTSLAAALTGRLPVTMEIRCFYISFLNGAPVAVPVVLVPRQDVTGADAALFEQIDASVHQWLDAAQPPANDARLSFDIAIWSTIAGIEVPLLHIADAALPMTAVESPTRL